MRRLSLCFVLSSLWVPALAGCGDDDGDPVADAAPPDAAPAPDAARPDAAPAPCPGQVLFTGSYVDWDGNSTGASNTLGTVVAGGAQSSTTITAPNGRVTLCLPADESSEVTFTNEDYLPLRYTFAPETSGSAFDLQGLTPARADELFTTLGLTRDPLLAQVIVAVRFGAANPEALGDAVEGARVTVGNAAAGAFTPDATGVLGAGDTLAGGAFVLFANAEIGDGTTTITVTAPEFVKCFGPEQIRLVAGEIAATMLACEIHPE